MSDAPADASSVVAKRTRRIVAAKRVAKARANETQPRLAKQSGASNEGLAKQPPTSNAALAKQTSASIEGLVAADSLARVAGKIRSMPKRSARATADSAETSLARVVGALRAPKRSANERADDAATSLERVARKLRAPSRTPKERADDVYIEQREPFDLHLPARPVSIELVGGRAHYDRVIAAVLAAHTSVWISTANVKGMMVEGSARPGARRTQKRGTYVSMVSRLDELAARGVELRLLHADLPSGPFREEIAAHPRLLDGGLALARCPRVHMKAVIVDGAVLYLGSANWTGAGLGAKGSGKRNFELGVITDDAQLLDQVQALFERVWSGAECTGCKLRDVCPGPLDDHPVRDGVGPVREGHRVRDPGRPRAKRSRRVARSSKPV